MLFAFDKRCRGLPELPSARRPRTPWPTGSVSHASPRTRGSRWTTTPRSARFAARSSDARTTTVPNLAEEPRSPRRSILCSRRSISTARTQRRICTPRSWLRTAAPCCCLAVPRRGVSRRRRLPQKAAGCRKGVPRGFMDRPRQHADLTRSGRGTARGYFSAGNCLRIRTLSQAARRASMWGRCSGYGTSACAGGGPRHEMKVVPTAIDLSNSSESHQDLTDLTLESRAQLRGRIILQAVHMIDVERQSRRGRLSQKLPRSTCVLDENHLMGRLRRKRVPNLDQYVRIRKETFVMHCHRGCISHNAISTCNLLHQCGVDTDSSVTDVGCHLNREPSIAPPARIRNLLDSLQGVHNVGA